MITSHPPLTTFQTIFAINVRIGSHITEGHWHGLPMGIKILGVLD
jgi:hypothetical protein